MSEYTAEKVLDLKGLPCPMPVVKMSQEIGSVDVGQIIEVHTTDLGPFVMLERLHLFRGLGPDLGQRGVGL